MTATGETVLHSRMDKGENHEGGVGFTLSRDAVQSLLEWEPVSERIIRVRFSSKRQQVAVLQCYALPQKIKQHRKRRITSMNMQLHARFEMNGNREMWTDYCHLNQ